jgi:PPOX class probable F420-dependent enzyme
MRQPKPFAPRIPASYGVPTDASGGERLPWSWAVDQLTSSRNYWIVTTRPDGRPHAAPVWGLWLDDAVWFSTARSSQKARNLARTQSVVVHLESGDEVVILEGDVHEEHEPDALERFADAYDTKYGFRPEPESEGAAVFVLRPRAAQTWLERDYPKTATRWVFE